MNGNSPGPPRSRSSSRPAGRPGCRGPGPRSRRTSRSARAARVPRRRPRARRRRASARVAGSAGRVTDGPSAHSTTSRHVTRLDGLARPTATASTVPARGARISFSIFIASIASSRWPPRPCRRALHPQRPRPGMWHGAHGPPVPGRRLARVARSRSAARASGSGRPRSASRRPRPRGVRCRRPCAVGSGTRQDAGRRGRPPGVVSRARAGAWMVRLAASGVPSTSARPSPSGWMTIVP